MSDSSIDLSNEFALDIIQKLPEPVLVSDQSKQAIWCNLAFSALIGPNKPIANQPINELLHAAMSPVDSSHNAICTHTHLDDNHTQSWFQHTEINLADNKIAHIFADVTVAVKARLDYNKIEQQLGELTTIEPVSGLLNKRAMLQNLEPLISRSRRYENPLSVIAVGILNFTLIAGRHGQSCADSSIVKVSQLLKDQLRWADIISRVDDSKLILILPETEHDDALFLANKIMSSIDGLEVTDDDNNRLKVDTSFGVASWQKGNDAKLLLNRAYRALDNAMANGSQSIVENQ